MRVLISGATGYLGQFLVVGLHASGHEVHVAHRGASCRVPFADAITMHPHCDVNTSNAPLPDAVASAAATTTAAAAGWSAAFSERCKFDVVINAAAVSKPAECEADPVAADAVNVPRDLVAAMRAAVHDARLDAHCLLLHVSTDQIYAGTRANNCEQDADADEPVNVYARTKRAAERYVRAMWPRSCIIRPSIIVGAQSPVLPVPRALFVQWLDATLASSDGCTLYEDEWRCPVLVHDIVDLAQALISRYGVGDAAVADQHRVLNVGSPQRLSRADMGDAVVRVRGHPHDRVKRVPTPQQRPFASPQDISMNSTRAEQLLGRGMTPFDEAVRRVFEASV